MVGLAAPANGRCLVTAMPRSLPALMRPTASRDGGEEDVHVACHQVGDRGRRPQGTQHLDAGHVPEDLGGEMRRAPAPELAKVTVPWRGLWPWR